ncbi:hypothetical protein, variant 3 [Phytophthora nicotianae INRA-310]|uniref:Uncharacterized protein n=2 Tax=Phytophthora nicotianae (strain INRA-310) TaxID=761204 RepID=W2Q149_PHYN3|nr:hypothetical protein, variant 3 [Phytophthora nicotianae INRA-310]ETN06918.1 hypothetical protein, variant 3 [Phytophthora nicotianae INRA-310]
MLPVIVTFTFTYDHHSVDIMPLLKRLLSAEELGDTPANATAEQLFASSIYAQEMRAQRQQAAAFCSAPLIAMSTLAAKRSGSSSALGNELEKLESCSIERCVGAALLVTREGKQVLFLVRDPKGVTKRLAVAVSSPNAAMTTELAAECLHRVRFRQCRCVYELLCELDHLQQNWEVCILLLLSGVRYFTDRAELDGQNEAGPELVVVGPLCDLFSDFRTASGITTTGTLCALVLIYSSHFGKWPPAQVRDSSAWWSSRSGGCGRRPVSTSQL